jgi:glycerol-3-phosphate dehydrogenase subunit C
LARAKSDPPAVNAQAPAYGRKVALFATCFANYNNPDIGTAALNVLAHNGVETEVVYPGCCGMPQLEQGDLTRVAGKAKATAQALKPYVEDGIDIVALVPSCALMMKFEWPLIVPDDKDVERLAKAVFDISEYVAGIIAKEGLAEGLNPIGGPIAFHAACHARAQNMGTKGADMLRAIPDAQVTVVERCSGHGGSWGIKTENFGVATKFARQTVRKVADAKPAHVCSECPLAGKHIVQGLEGLGDGAPGIDHSTHPIQILAKAYGF